MVYTVGCIPMYTVHCVLKPFLGAYTVGCIPLQIKFCLRRPTSNIFQEEDAIELTHIHITVTDLTAISHEVWAWTHPTQQGCINTSAYVK